MIPPCPRWILVAALWGAAAPALAAPMDLPRSAPEVQGVSSARLLGFVEAVDQQLDALNSFMLVRHGNVVAEGWWAPYDREANHELYSLSKSFTSTAVGLAVAEGRFSLDDQVLKFFPEDAPAEPTPNLKAMRVRDLLCMSTGHQDEPSAAADMVSPKTFLAQPVPYKPGTHFKYNTAATFMLSAIVQKRTGLTVLDYLRPRLFEPLGVAHPVWSTNFQGVSLGGYGLRVRTEDIAKFGQLYLNRGLWNGVQLIPESWVAAATSRQTSNGSNPESDWDQGYGYQFWRCRHGAFRGDGAFGQYCLVLPEQDAVVAITSGLKDMQAVLNLVWDKLLPALASNPLAPDPENRAKLDSKLASLRLRLPAGDPIPAAAKFSGRVFQFPANPEKLESVAIEPAPSGSGYILATKSNGLESRLPIGSGGWAKGRGAFGSYANEPVAVAGVSEPGGAGLILKLCAFETPFYATLKLRFEGDQVVRELEQNVGFGTNRQAPLTGRAP